MRGKYTTLVAAFIIVALTATSLLNCSSPPQEKPTTTTRPASTPATVIADGNLTMPHQAKLNFKLGFGTSATVKSIPVKEGDNVRAGTLLVKLDDTQQKLAIASSLYNVELALNELAEKVYPSILGFPNYYPSTSVVLRIEQALEGIKQTPVLLEQSKPKDAAAKLRLAQYDLEASIGTLQTALNNYIPNPLNETTNYIPDEVLNYSGANVKDLIKHISQDVKNLVSVQTFLEKANYGAASAMLKMALRGNGNYLQ